ncbi:MAG: UDP-N-acetylmuramoyl-tripeptide--D-alanyl-D-alanine ligase [Acidimicrobiia bacterium]
MELTPAWIAAQAGGRVGAGVLGRSRGDGVAFDSRTVEPGQVFVALRDVRDGHEFVADALTRGAAFAIVERPVRAENGAELPCVEVADTREALSALGRAARERLSAQVVGITGSVGKTSTKDLAAAALGSRWRTHAAPASFNNEIGVPFTLLGAPEAAEAVVIEMGARFAGNIAELCQVAQPTIGVITNIGLAHAEHLGGPDGVARVKGELLEALPADGLAVVSAACAATAGQLARSRAAIVTVGIERHALVRVSDVQVGPDLRASFNLHSPWGEGTVTLAMRGAHQVVNAAQAATVALHLGAEREAVFAALASATSTGWRMKLRESPAGIVVLNDSYNASPAAMMAAIESLAQLRVAGRRVAVLGEMRELGDWSHSEHARVGDALGRAGIDVLIAVGAATAPLVDAARKLAPTMEIHMVMDAEAARTATRELLQPGDAVLVKASRAVGLEIVAEALLRAEPVA